MKKNSCPYKSAKVLTEKQAKKEPVGSFYHPTEETYRSGACPIGKSLKKGYQRKMYIKKDGTKIASAYVDPICIPNKGLPGKTIKEHKIVKLSKKDELKPYGYSTHLNIDKRFESLLKAIEDLSYKTVVLRLSVLRTYHRNDIDKKYWNIYNEDMKKLKEWRDKNPDLYKLKKSINLSNTNNKMPKNMNINNKMPKNMNINNKMTENINNKMPENMNINNKMPKNTNVNNKK